MILLTYTPRLSHLKPEEERELRGLGFNLPHPDLEGDPRLSHSDDQVHSLFESPPEEKGDQWFEGLAELNEDQRDLLEELQQRAVVLRRRLEEEEIILEEYGWASKSLRRRITPTRCLWI